MIVSELIAELQKVDPDNIITPLANSLNGEDPDFDIYLNNIEVWNDGDESVTLFMSNITEYDIVENPIERVPNRKLNTQ
jgi:hypothetical protein